MSLRGLVLAALLAGLTAVGAVFSISVPALSLVNFTLQVFFVLLSGALLGARYGAVSQVVYLLMGVAGLPVFAGLRSGPGHLVGPTGGFLLSFPVAAWLVGYLAPPGSRQLRILGAMMAGLAVIYVMGATGLYLYFNLLKGQDMSLLRVWAIGVGPFILFDLTKAILASVVASAAQRALSAAGLSEKLLGRGASLGKNSSG